MIYDNGWVIDLNYGDESKGICRIIPKNSTYRKNYFRHSWKRGDIEVVKKERVLGPHTLVSWDRPLEDVPF